LTSGAKLLRLGFPVLPHVLHVKRQPAKEIRIVQGIIAESHCSAGGSLVAGRRTGTSGKGNAVMTPHNLGKITVGVIRLSKLAGRTGSTVNRAKFKAVRDAA
jgi:hypothetical protein